MSQNQRPDYYEVLGVDRTATEAEIKRAYRQLGRKYHPDVRPGDRETEERFKQISEAYSVLSNPERRARYDRYGHDGPGLGGFEHDAGPFDFFDLFATAFGGDPFGFGRRTGHERQVGRSLGYELEITLQEVLTGADKEIAYTRLAACDTCDGSGAAPGTSPRQCGTCGGVGQVRAAHNTFIGTISTIQDCPACRGAGRTVDDPCGDCRGQGVERRSETLTVTIPAGVEAGAELVLRGFGEAPLGGGIAGDLHVRVSVADHERFLRRGNDLHTELPVSISQAALGDTVTVETLDGPAEVEIPAGSQHGDKRVISGRGLPRMRSSQRGDLYLHLRLGVPTDLTPRQRELLMEFAAERGEALSPEDRTLFDRIRDAISGR